MRRQRNRKQNKELKIIFTLALSTFVVAVGSLLAGKGSAQTGKPQVTVTPTPIAEATVAPEKDVTEVLSGPQLYFGQLHSHTTYSDGDGSLASALNYIANLPESANVDFVAFTDHSNYFDSSSSANPEGALYDMSLAGKESKNTWSSYVSAMLKFNEEQDGILAVPGFEMTWSGGPGHMNTFNTAGIVSRNNEVLNNKTEDAGIQAYYDLLSRPEGKDSISMFNHPGEMFGNFVNFDFWNPIIDSRVYLLEVGNGSGQVHKNGYYPSYEQYSMALDAGWHVAPSNNQDNHGGRWGNANDARTVVLAEELTLEGIYEGIRNYRVYATEDKNLEIRYTVNGAEFGTIFEERPEMLDILVQLFDPDATDSIKRVEVITNGGKKCYQWEGDSLEAKITGADSKSTTVECREVYEMSVSLPVEYDYYYIRVTQKDGDVAVTAPVWMEQDDMFGISGMFCDTEIPVTGSEVMLSVKLYNGSENEAKIKNIMYTAEDGAVLGIDSGAVIPAMTCQEIPFSYIPETAGNKNVTASVIFETADGEYTYETTVEYEVKDSKELFYIGVDASHDNEYVAGSYKNSLGKFTELAAEYSAQVIFLRTSEELVKACNDPLMQAIIITAPSRRLDSAKKDPKYYSAEEIEAIRAFSMKGGAVILTGWSDYYEKDRTFLATGKPHMAETQNDILEAVGSHLRISDDGAYDNQNNGGQNYRLYFDDYNWYADLTNGISQTEDSKFSQYSGATIYAVDETGNTSSTAVESIIPIVYAHSSTYSSDSDGDGFGTTAVPKYENGAGEQSHLILATETVTWPDGTESLVVVSGAAFLSDYEMGGEYTNLIICRNLISGLQYKMNNKK